MTSGQYSVPAMSVERSLAYYEDFLFSSYEKWIQLEPRRVFEMERKAWQDYDKFSAAKKGNKGDFCVSLNPYARSFVPPVQWNIAATTILKSKLRATDFVGFKILVCPCVGNDGIKEVAVGDFGSNILTLLAEGQLQIHLISQILKDYVDLDVFKESDVESLVNKEILYLLSNNLITLNY